MWLEGFLGFAAEDEAAAGSEGEGEGFGFERDWATSGERTRNLGGVFPLGG